MQSNQPQRVRLSLLNLLPAIVRSVSRHSVPSVGPPPPPSAVCQTPSAVSAMKIPVWPSLLLCVLEM